MTSVSEKTAGGGGAVLAQPLLARLRKHLADLAYGSNDRARLQRDALTAFTVRVLSAGLLYLSQIVLARWMGGVEYGIYVFVWTWVLVLGGLSNLGLSTVFIRLIPEYRETGNLDLLRGLLRYGRLLAFGAATLVAMLGFGALHLFGATLTSSYLLPATLALICVPMITLTDVQDGIGRGGGWIVAGLLPPYILRPLLVLLAMIAASALHWPMVAETAVILAIAATWTTAAVQFLLLQRRLKTEVPHGPRQRRSDLWLGTSLPLLAITGSELLLQSTDVLVISYFLAPDQVAIYFAAAKTMALVLFVHYAVGSAMAKRFALLNARGDTLALKSFVRDAVHWTFWPSLVAAALILVLGQPLLWMFGPQFEAGYPVMFVLVAGFLGRAAMGPSEFLLNMLGQQKACAAVIASMAALNIALQIVAVPRLGIIGAAAATSTVLMLGALLNTLIARRRLGLDIAIWNNLRRTP